MKPVPYVQNKGRGQIVRLGGINYSNILSDGDLADCKNISASKFPYITTAKETQKMQGVGYENAEAMTSFYNLITFADDKIYLDGHEYTDLPTNEKQIAIVNGKMMVLPEQTLVSLQNKYSMQDSDSDITDLNKLISYLNKKAIYAGGTHYFFPAIGGVKTVQQINDDEFHDQQETAYTYYQMCDSGNILTGEDKTPVQVEKEDIIGVRYNSEGIIYFKSASKVQNYGGVIDSLPAFSETYVPEKFYIMSPAQNLIRAIYRNETVYYKTVQNRGSGDADINETVSYLNGLSLYLPERVLNYTDYKVTGEGGYIYYGDGGAQSVWADTGDVIRITYSNSTRKYKLYTEIFEHTEKTVDEINAQPYTEESVSVAYYIVTTDGNIKYGVDDANTLSVIAGDLITIAYNQSKTVYYKSAEKVTETPDDLSDISITRDTGDWLYVLNGKGEVLSDIARYGLHYTKGNTHESITVVSDGSTKRSIASIDAQCIDRALDSSDYEGTYNKTVESFLTANENVQITHGLTSEIKQVANVSGNKATITAFIPVVNMWYTFRLLEDPDFCCEWNNRLWCVSSDKQLIFASVQGKPDDFLSEMGLSTGAFQVTIGDIEPFTGMTKFESSILFFKQNRIYKILGSSPKNYELFSYEMEGVKSGCHKSICTIGGILYYVGLHGVYAYSGGSPVLISSNLGNMEMENAVGGTDGERYFLSFESNGADYFFTYEPKYNIWMKNESIKVTDFARKGEETYYLDGREKTVYKMNSGDTPDNMEWYAQFTPFYETIEGKKRYSKLIIRADVSKKAYMSVKIRADGGVWTEVGIIKGNTQNTQTMRIPITRCDKFELRLEGQGKCTIHEILREFDLGSDVL